MNITELLKADIKVNLTVSALDLKEFALSLIAEARRLEAETPKVVDKELTAQEVARQLGVTVPTLWRWEKRKYLVPHARVGNHPMYLQSQINELKGIRN